MDRNLLLAFALSFLVLMLWSSLQEPPPRRPPQGESAPAAREEAPAQTEPSLAPLPTGPAEELVAESAEPQPTPAVAEIYRFEREFPVDRRVGGYRATLTDVGAGLRHWELAHYHTGGASREPIVLSTGQAPHGLLGATPLPELGFGDLSRVAWEVESWDEQGMVFHLARNGVTLRKSWSFEDSYTIRLRLDLENRSDSDVTTDFAVDWPAGVAEGNDFREQALVALHQGSLEQQLLAGFGQAGFFSAFSGPPAKFIDYKNDNEWAGVHTTYFLSALLPEDAGKAHVRFEALEPGRSGVTRIYFDRVRIPSGLSLSREFRGYLGPKLPAELERLGSESIRAIDLGWSWVRPLTRFFGWMLHEIHAFVPNYGVAIILLTILVRVVTTPLTLRQMKSMERMRAVQPQLKEIQEKYKDDRQKQSEAMMSLYRKEKVNPLGGCLPMLLQLPVFIGLFYALRGSIQLRQAPFVAWIDDLSAPETLFEIPGIGIPIRVLPLVMGASMVLQQRITPMQMDPAQARMMMTIMPIMMTVIFYQFASGLVLYWMVSNVLAIAHQLWVGRRMRSGQA